MHHEKPIHYVRCAAFSMRYPDALARSRPIFLRFGGTTRSLTIFRKKQGPLAHPATPAPARAAPQIRNNGQTLLGNAGRSKSPLAPVLPYGFPAAVWNAGIYESRTSSASRFLATFLRMNPSESGICAECKLSMSFLLLPRAPTLL